MTELEKHLNSFHNFDTCGKFSENTTNFEIQSQNTYSDLTVEKPADSLHPVVIESDCKKLEESYEENLKKSYDPAIKQLCNICSFAFISGKELRQHMTKHTSNMRAPSILKKLRCVSVAYCNEERTSMSHNSIQIYMKSILCELSYKRTFGESIYLTEENLVKLFFASICYTIILIH